MKFILLTMLLCGCASAHTDNGTADKIPNIIFCLIAVCDFEDNPEMETSESESENQQEAENNANP